MQTLYFDDKYVGRVVGGTLSFVLIGLVIYLRIMIKGAHFLIKTVEIRFKISLPLIPHSLANIVLAQFDRIMINSYLGPAAGNIFLH